MKASTCVAKVCFTLRHMTADSEEEPFLCLRIADLLTLRTLLFMGLMIPQSVCEHNEWGALSHLSSSVYSSTNNPSALSNPLKPGGLRFLIR